MVLHLNFAIVNSKGDIEENFRNYINGEVDRFSEKYHDDCKILKRPIKINENNHIESIADMLWSVSRRGVEKQIYLIVDEYDSFVNRQLLEVVVYRQYGWWSTAT